VRGGEGEEVKSIKGGSEMEDEENIRENGEVDSTCDCLISITLVVAVSHMYTHLMVRVP